MSSVSPSQRRLSILISGPPQAGVKAHDDARRSNQLLFLLLLPSSFDVSHCRSCWHCTDRHLYAIRDEEEVKIAGFRQYSVQKEANRDTGGTAWNGLSILPRTMSPYRVPSTSLQRVSLGSCVHFLNCLFVLLGVDLAFWARYHRHTLSSF
ncbi:hypothetical protein GGI35DRAFT_336120 [Trichoderma velutinum]